MYEQEEWRPIPGFPGYEISSLGRVLSTKGRNPRILRPGRAGDLGYPFVDLRANGRGYSLRVHRLVTEIFVGPCPTGMEVRHKDSNPRNCRLDNLAYGTHAENMRDRLLNGTNHQVNKVACPAGHPYDAENTYVAPSEPTARHCRTCRRDRARERRINAAFRAAGIKAA